MTVNMLDGSTGCFPQTKIWILKINFLTEEQLIVLKFLS